MAARSSFVGAQHLAHFATAGSGPVQAESGTPGGFEEYVLADLWVRLESRRSSQHFESSDMRRPCAIPHEDAGRAVVGTAESTPSCIDRYSRILCRQRNRVAIGAFCLTRGALYRDRVESRRERER